jgi:glyceraldehyde-3-phosphate dehydrogenase/erythrose-4-phosphate dehydrogenase
MNHFSIGIVGAGHASIEMLHQLLKADYVTITGIADMNDNAPGIALARAHGIPTSTDMADILADGEKLDILIDVTGVKKVRDMLRKHMQESGNQHTVIMHERISALMISLANKKLVDMKSSDDDY